MSPSSPTKYPLPASRTLSIASTAYLYVTSRSLSVDARDLKRNPLDAEEEEDPLTFFLKQGKKAAAFEALMSSSAGLPLPIIGEYRPQGSSKDGDGDVMWYRGPIKSFETQRSTITAQQVAQYIEEAKREERSTCFLYFFLRIGTTTFRLLSIDDPTTTSNMQQLQLTSSGNSNENLAASHLNAGGGEESAGDESAVAAGAGLTPFKRAKDRYSQAVAFEFVSNLMDSVVLVEDDE